MKSCCNKEGKMKKRKEENSRGEWAVIRKGETGVAEKRRERRVEGYF